MLDIKTKREIDTGIELGFSDVAIAKNLGIKSMAVFTYRTKNEISAKTVVKNRYIAWGNMIKEGVPTSKIAEIYHTTERSVRVMLWNAGFSFKEAKKEQKNNVEISLPTPKKKTPKKKVVKK